MDLLKKSQILKNILEKCAFDLYPALKRIKNLLNQNKQANFVRMTGSGSAIIMYFNSNKFAKNALKIYKRKLNKCFFIITKII
jgi:4-diphosphocytidyl-2-C-methyl-D-erythritol kinase